MSSGVPADALTDFVESIVRRTIDAAIRDGRLQPVRQAEAGPAKRTLTSKEVAERYGVSVRTLADWRSGSAGPVWTKPGKVVLYRVEDLEAYFAAKRVRTLEADRLAASPQ